MHALIAKTPENMDTDHINGDGLDNRRENLRIATHRENMQNLHILKSSKHPGITWCKKHKKWRAKIYVLGRHYSLGEFDDQKSAADAYLNACKNPEILKMRVKTSKYKGVHWNSRAKLWVSMIYFSNRSRYLGYYNTEEQAALRHHIAHDWQIIDL